MLYVLDTDTVIDILKGRQPARAAYQSHSPDDLAVCTMTVAELHYGVSLAADPATERRKVDVFLAPLAILPFDVEAAERHALFRRALRSMPIGERDLVIASTVPASDATLITRNRREFDRVPGLLVDSWMS
jgi:tRNA(fMet)-specific endonuclease VapC